MGALAPPGPLAGTFRQVYRTIARLADAAGVPLFVVGGYSSLRPAPGADREGGHHRAQVNLGH